MCAVGRTDYDAFIPASESIVHQFRVATYVKDIDKAIHLGKHIKAMGYRVSVSIVAVSHPSNPTSTKPSASSAKRISRRSTSPTALATSTPSRDTTSRRSTWS